MSNTISCGCGKTIPAHGDTTCHCAGCHQSFAGISAFDRHRQGGTCATLNATHTETGTGWSIDHEDLWHWGEQRTPDQWQAAAEARSTAARTRLAEARR